MKQESDDCEVKTLQRRLLAVKKLAQERQALLETARGELAAALAAPPQRVGELEAELAAAVERNAVLDRLLAEASAAAAAAEASRRAAAERAAASDGSHQAAEAALAAAQESERAAKLDAQATRAAMVAENARANGAVATAERLRELAKVRYLLPLVANLVEGISATRGVCGFEAEFEANTCVHVFQAAVSERACVKAAIAAKLEAEAEAQRYKTAAEHAELERLAAERKAADAVAALKAANEKRAKMMAMLAAEGE